MSIKDFLLKHTTGIVLACFAGGGGIIVHNVYDAMIAQAQAYAAANQVEDSMASWMLHQQTSYGDVIPNMVIFGTLLVVTLCLLPTIKHAIKLMVKTD